MLREEFEEKFPSVSWDFHFDEDQCYVGYPMIEIDFIVDSCIWFSVTAETIESCFEIASKILVKLEEVDYSETESYVGRAISEHNDYFDRKNKSQSSVEVV